MKDRETSFKQPEIRSRTVSSLILGLRREGVWVFVQPEKGGEDPVSLPLRNGDKCSDFEYPEKRLCVVGGGGGWDVGVYDTYDFSQ